jgi:hypothetical protein
MLAHQSDIYGLDVVGVGVPKDTVTQAVDLDQVAWKKSFTLSEISVHSLCGGTANKESY